MQESPRQLLIVDDSVLVIRRLTKALQDVLKNTDVTAILNGTDLLNIIHKVRPSVVLLDIQLPGVSGIELLKQIRATYPDIKVIMLTNQSGSRIRKTCLQEGAHGFYDKTKEFEKAIEHIKNLSCETHI